MEDLKQGMKVHYDPKFGRKENGIVKTVKEDKTGAFIVYHLVDDWNNYMNYTGQLTSIEDLKEGWIS